MKFEERLTKKLYEVRDKEGKPHQETFEALRALEKVLEDQEEFVGLDPHGSTIKGYSDEDSDIDIRVRIDVGTDKVIENADSIASITNAIDGKIREFKPSLEEKIGKKIHTSFFLISTEVNLKLLQQRLLEDDVDPFIVGSIFRRISGKKIKEYREPVIEMIKSLDTEERERIISKMAEGLTEDEWVSRYKIKERTGEHVDISDFKRKRQNMWEKRILSFIEA